MTGLYRLDGGPHDGEVVRASPGCPAFLLGEPVRPTLLDSVDGELRWNDALAWYELHRADAADLGHP